MPYDEDRAVQTDPAETQTARSQERSDAPTRDRPAPQRETRREPPPQQRDEDRAADHDRDDDRDDAADSGGDGGKGDDGKQRRRRPRWLIPALIVGAVLVIGLGLWYYESTAGLVSTDDAYTDGNAVMVAPQISGQVIELAVNDNQFVHKGQLLLRIDPRPFIAARDQARGTLEQAEGQVAAAEQGLAVARKNFPARLASAQAQLQSAQATLFQANANLHRQQALPKVATTQQDIDNAIAAQRSAEAQVAAAQAAVEQALPVQPNIGQAQAQVKQLQGLVAQAQGQLAQAELNLGWTTVVAPQDGWVTKRNVNQGNYVQAGSSMLSLVTPDVWVTANFKETQLNRMRPGQPVRISVDAYPSLKLTGRVDSIQLGSGSKFSAFPAENATGNFVKIVQRVPVKIDITGGLDPKLPLPLGLSVEPSVNVAGG